MPWLASNGYSCVYLPVPWVCVCVVCGAMVGVDKPEDVVKAVKTTNAFISRLRADQIACMVGCVPCTNCRKAQLVTSPYSLRIINAGTVCTNRSGVS